MKQIIFALLFITAVSCTQRKSNPSETGNDTTIVSDAPINEVSGKQCYLGVVGKDSVFFEMQRTGESFSGFLFYNRFESDSSIGEFNGVISGDTIKGVFDFMSEGMISVIDKYFLIKDGQLQEGQGPLSEVNDYTLVFKNPEEVEFGKSYNLSKTECSPDFITQKDKDFYYNLKKQ